jgi:hypothetical protein
VEDQAKVFREANKGKVEASSYKALGEECIGYYDKKHNTLPTWEQYVQYIAARSVAIVTPFAVVPQHEIVLQYYIEQHPTLVDHAAYTHLGDPENRPSLLVRMDGAIVRGRGKLATSLTIAFAITPYAHTEKGSEQDRSRRICRKQREGYDHTTRLHCVCEGQRK